MKKLFSKGNKPKAKIKVVGDVRQSQLINTFGVGSMVDFVNETVMIAGIDAWKAWSELKPENPYILSNENLQNYLGVDYFVKPRVDSQRKSIYSQKSNDIPAYRFPETLYCTHCHRLFNYKVFDHQGGKQLKCMCGNKTLVPSRFVVICENGHIDDFPYNKWVHQGKECPKEGKKAKLYLKNKDGKSGIDSLYVYCSSCGAIRTMKTAFRENVMKEFSVCEGSTPWLNKRRQGSCTAPLKTRLRSASNIYFPANVSALSIPPWSKKIYKELDKNYSSFGESAEVNRYIIEHNIMPYLKGLSYEDILAALESLRNNKEQKGEKNAWDIFEDEYRTIVGYHKEVDNDEDYSAEVMETPKKYKSIIDKVIAIDKLTEVNALIGFTRSIPWTGSFEDKHLQKLSEIDIFKLPIDQRKDKGYWLPAVELKGEGIFLEFNLEKLKKWSSKFQDYYQPIKERADKEKIHKENFSPEYILLHTLSHLIIRQLSLESGYSSASLKEKIYSTYKEKGNIEMAGILIYTATTDSDGSLGGLVEQAYPERLEAILDNSLKEACWCASDPVCINSYGKYGQGYKSLNYGACHNCTLLPETSCEFRNLMLDRGAIVGTAENKELGFFYEYL